MTKYSILRGCVMWDGVINSTFLKKVYGMYMSFISLQFLSSDSSNFNHQPSGSENALNFQIDVIIVEEIA
jgi:hypothetical protein